MKKLATIDLPSTNANAFEVLVRCQSAAEKAGAEQAKIQTFLEDAVQGDFEHLLRVVNTHFEVSSART